MIDDNSRFKSYVAVGVMCVGFAIMYPIIIRPMIIMPLSSNMVSTSKPSNNPRAHLNHKLHRHRNNQTPQKGGILTTILPIYAVGILLYFSYTLFKLFKSKNNQWDLKKEKYLKDYYRNFRFNSKKKKFVMDSDSSDGSEKIINKSPDCGKFDWNSAYTSESESSRYMSDIYRSAKGLPRDLEYLLKKVDDNSLDDTDIQCLRIHLDEMELEMTRLLKAVSSSSSKSSKPINSFDQNASSANPNFPSQCHTHLHMHSTVMAQEKSSDYEEELYSANEEEYPIN